MTHEQNQPATPGGAGFGLDSFLDMFNIIDRLDGLLGWLLSAIPHRRTTKGHPTGPYVVEAGMHELHIQATGAESASGRQAEAALRHYGIHVWGRRITDDAIIMSVRTRQANWAEHVLLRAGISFAPAHRFHDPRANAWSARHAGPVPAWADRNKAIAGPVDRSTSTPGGNR